MTQQQPTLNGPNGGRAPGGKFAKGNPGGPGNPHARKVGQLRAALLRSVAAKDLQEVVRKLVSMAKDGDLDAIRELLDRLLGKPVPVDLEDRMGELETLLETLRPTGGAM